MPGTVLILLAGKYIGKRVVLLKTLPKSGLVVVTGPFAINGVPIRRVNPAYAIATTTKVDISTLELPKRINDKYFKKNRKQKDNTKSAEKFLGEKKEKEEGQPKEKLRADRKEDQVTVDKPLIELIKKVPYLKNYLQSRFYLREGEYPHALKF